MGARKGGECCEVIVREIPEGFTRHFNRGRNSAHRCLFSEGRKGNSDLRDQVFTRCAVAGEKVGTEENKPTGEQHDHDRTPSMERATSATFCVQTKMVPRRLPGQSCSFRLVTAPRPAICPGQGNSRHPCIRVSMEVRRAA
jgi:hypothetical protein